MSTAIIGAGGIGSHFCRILSRMLTSHQLGLDVEPGTFTVFDFDVVEPKNVKWQDFSMTDIGVPKAMLMTLWYGYVSKVKRFAENDLPDYTSYIIAADNPKVRNLVFNFAHKVKRQFVDMRAEGDMIAVFTDACTLKVLQDSLKPEPESTAGASCQRVVDQENNVVQLGNWAAAVAGMDILLRRRRNAKCPDSIVRSVV